MIKEVEEFQKVKSGDVQRKTSPVDVISGTELGGPPLIAWADFSPSAVFSSWFRMEAEPLSLHQSTCCPRNPLFVDKKPEGLKG